MEKKKKQIRKKKRERYFETKKLYLNKGISARRGRKGPHHPRESLRLSSFNSIIPLESVLPGNRTAFAPIDFTIILLGRKNQNYGLFMFTTV